MFERLFSPIRIRDMELENRVVMTGMGTRMVGGDGREVTDRLIRYHVERARGGVGLNTVEVCSVDAASAPKGFLALSDDKYIPGMKKLADAVHEAGGKICPQLWQGSLAVGSDPDAEIFSCLKMRLSRKVSIKGMSKERIHSIVKAYGEAARRAAQAGMDAVEFHAAHTYLPCFSVRRHKSPGQMNTEAALKTDADSFECIRLFVRIFRKGCLFS